MSKRIKTLRCLAALSLMVGVMAALAPTAGVFAMAAGTTTLGNTTAGQPSSHTETFTTGAGGSLAAGVQTITVTFDAAVTVPTAASATVSNTSNVTVAWAGGASFVAATFVAVTPVVAGQAVTVTTPIAIPGGTLVTVVFLTAFGLRNPVAVGANFVDIVSTSTEPFPVANPAYFTTAGTGPTAYVTSVAVTPNTALLAGQYNIMFTSDSILNANADTITVRFQTTSNTAGVTTGVGLPATMNKATVNISGIKAGTAVASSQNVAVDPSVNVQLGTVTLVVPNMDPVSGINPNLAAGTVTVSFSPLAGIINPNGASNATFDNTTSTAGVTPTGNASTQSFRVKVVTSKQPGTVAAALPLGSPNIDPELFVIRHVLQLSVLGAARNSSVTITGTGYANGGTATVWLDNGAGVGGVANDGIINGTETILATAGPIAGNQFTATFTVGSAFTLGAFDFIQAQDGFGQGSSRGAGAAATLDFVVFASVQSRAPTSGPPGTLVTITVQDFPPGALTVVSIGGVSAGAPPIGLVIPASGTLTFPATVPATAPQGTQRLEIRTALSATASTFTVTGATVGVTPSTVVANQVVTITGSGFAPSSVAGGLGAGGVHVIPIGGLTFDGFGINATAITLDTGGNLVAQITLPNTGSATRQGQYNVVVTDDVGRMGTFVVTVATPTLALAPQASQIGTTVTANGTGFPANGSVTLIYGLTMNAPGTAVATVSADTSGTFTATFLVPTSAAIPSANTVSATSAIGGVIATATHSVPNVPLPPLVVLTTSLPQVVLGTPYSQTLAATGGVSPYTWSTIVGALPPGITLTAATGAVSGIPTALGSFAFTVQVRDAFGVTVTQGLSIGVMMTSGTAVTRTLKPGWNTVSVPFVLVTPAFNAILPGCATAACSNLITTAFAYQNGAWLQVTTDNQAAVLGQPMTGLYVFITGTAQVTATFTPSTSPNPPPTKGLVQGWNLVGPSALTGSQSYAQLLTGLPAPGGASPTAVVVVDPNLGGGFSTTPTTDTVDQVKNGFAYWVFATGPVSLAGTIPTGMLTSQPQQKP